MESYELDKSPVVSAITELGSECDFIGKDGGQILGFKLLEWLTKTTGDVVLDLHGVRAITVSGGCVLLSVIREYLDSSATKRIVFRDISDSVHAALSNATELLDRAPIMPT